MLQSGVRLGPYEVLEPLGSGAMGEVYRARDPRLSRQVAIKVLPEHLSGDPGRLERFRQEALAAGALNHPNIAAALDAGQHDGIAYIVFEMLEGATLRDHLESGPLPPAGPSTMPCSSPTPSPRRTPAGFATAI